MGVASDLLMVFKPTLTTIGALTLDASLSETHTGEVDVTDYPVETGADISDHAQPKPDKVTIEGLVTNTPINQAVLLSRLAGIPSALAGIPSDISNAFQNTIIGGGPSTPDLVKLAAEQLYALKNSRSLITIVTSLRTYTNMIMVSLSIPRDAKTGDALRFTANFKAIRMVDTMSATIAVAAAPKVTKGTVVPTTPSPPEQSESILYGGSGSTLEHLTGITSSGITGSN